jgi:hypothetical protein
MKIYRIAVKSDYRWNRVRVSGREFCKEPVELAENIINDEILNSPLLDVTEIEPPKPPRKRAGPPEPSDSSDEEVGNDPVG